MMTRNSKNLIQKFQAKQRLSMKVNKLIRLGKIIHDEVMAVSRKQGFTRRLLIDTDTIKVSRDPSDSTLIRVDLSAYDAEIYELKGVKVMSWGEQNE